VFVDSAVCSSLLPSPPPRCPLHLTSLSPPPLRPSQAFPAQRMDDGASGVAVFARTPEARAHVQVGTVGSAVHHRTERVLTVRINHLLLDPSFRRRGGGTAGGPCTWYCARAWWPRHKGRSGPSSRT